MTLIKEKILDHLKFITNNIMYIKSSTRHINLI